MHLSLVDVVIGHASYRKKETFDTLHGNHLPFQILGLVGHKINLISISDSANRRLDPFQNRKVLDTALRTKFNTVDGEKDSQIRKSIILSVFLLRKVLDTTHLVLRI